MKKTRLIFFVIILLIFLGMIFFFNSYTSDVKPGKGKLSAEHNWKKSFFITGISGKGDVYKGMSGKSTIKVLHKSLDKGVHINTFFKEKDFRTSFQFIYSGISYTALPGSRLYYHKTEGLYLYEGEFYWETKAKIKKGEIYLGSSKIMLKQSLKGRVSIKHNSVTIWNYKGDLELTAGGVRYFAKRNEALEIESTEKSVSVEKYNIASSPGPVTSSRTRASRTNKDERIVSLVWKDVKEADWYVLRIYSSRFREIMLYENLKVQSNKKIIDISSSKFADYPEIFWEIYPVNSDTPVEGAVSEMGSVILTGALLDRDEELEKPALNIRSLSVSGNMVLIKGEADINSQLFINEENVRIDSDGGFFHTITYNSIGQKEIVFRLISPLEVETLINKKITIFEE